MKKILIIWAVASLLLSCEKEPVGTDTPIDSDSEITIGTEQITFLASGEPTTGENKVAVTSSGEWRLTGKKTWCTPSSVSGKSGDQVSFVAQENDTEQTRSITYTFFCGAKAVRFVVTQEPNHVFEVEQDAWVVPAEGSAKVKIGVESSALVTSEVEESAKEWIVPLGTRSMTSYLYYKVPANDTYAQRVGHITVSCEGAEPRVITITQERNEAIKAEKERYEISEGTTQLNMTVWSNVPYDVVIPDDVKSWLSVRAQPTDAQEWSSQQLVFDVSAQGYKIAVVELVSKDQQITTQVAVQHGEPKIFQVPDKAFREYLIKQKYIEASGDGYTTTAAGVSLTSLSIYSLYSLGMNGVASAVGIENFPNLTSFDCRFSRIKSLDLSQNTKIADLTNCVPSPFEYLKVPAGITSFVCSGKFYDYATGGAATRVWSEKFVIEGPDLTRVEVPNNRLKTLDVSGCPALTTLICTQASGYTLQSITLSESQRGNVTIDFKGATLIYK